MPFVCTRMSSICHSYVLVCMYVLVCNGMSLVSTRMSSVCHLYVFVCHTYTYVTRMHSYVIRMSLVYTRMLSICHSHVLACHPYVTHMYSFYKHFNYCIDKGEFSNDLKHADIVPIYKKNNMRKRKL